MTRPAPSFFSPYAHDFLRVAVCVPRIEPASPRFNADRTLELLREADAQRVGLMAFPELGISAYAIDDLLFQDALLDAVEAEIARLVEASRDLYPVFAVGAPLRIDGRLYNTAVVIGGGRILGVTPKIYLPNYREFYEKRWFTSGQGVVGRTLRLAGQDVPFGTDLIYRGGGSAPVSFHVEICEDVWVAEPPSGRAALAGAEVLLNLSASNITIGKAEARRLLCASQSARCAAVYAYSAAGPGESTTDLAWDGHASIFELGELLAETERFALDSTLAVADVDLGRLRQERMRTNSLGDNAAAALAHGAPFRQIDFTLDAPAEPLDLIREVERFPYVPADPARLADD